MTQLHPVTVRILDKDYHVGCPAAERANLESAARYLDGKMREIRDGGKIFGLERIAVLAALNISYEMLQAQPGNSGPERAPREQVGDLLERIDRQLHGDDPALRRQQQRQIQQQAGIQRSLPPTPQVEAPQPRAAQPAQQPQASQPLQSQQHSQQMQQWSEQPALPPSQPAMQPPSRPVPPWEQPQAAPAPVEPVQVEPLQDGWNPQLETDAGWNPPPVEDFSQDNWQLPPDDGFQPQLDEQGSWQDNSQHNPYNLQRAQQQGQHPQREESPPAGSGFPDDGLDFRLPPQ